MGQRIFATWLPWVLAALSIGLSSAAQVVLKVAVSTGAVQLSHLLREPWVWLGVGLYAASAGTWLAVLARLPLIVAYPLLGMNFVLVGAAGYFLLGERLSTLGVTGYMLVLAGIALIGAAGR